MLSYLSILRFWKMQATEVTALFRIVQSVVSAQARNGGNIHMNVRQLTESDLQNRAVIQIEILQCRPADTRKITDELSRKTGRLCTFIVDNNNYYLHINRVATSPVVTTGTIQRHTAAAVAPRQQEQGLGTAAVTRVRASTPSHVRETTPHIIPDVVKHPPRNVHFAPLPRSSTRCWDITSLFILACIAVFFIWNVFLANQSSTTRAPPLTPNIPTLTVQTPAVK